MKFGYWKAFPENARAGWGARAILRKGSLDIPFDRQTLVGDSKLDRQELVKILNKKVLSEIKSQVKALFAQGELSSAQEKEHVLYDSKDVRAIGNTNASGGYFYLLVFLR